MGEGKVKEEPAVREWEKRKAEKKETARVAASFFFYIIFFFIQRFINSKHVVKIKEMI